MEVPEIPEGIEFASLAPGTILLVRTQQSLYVLELRGGNEVEVSGGRHFPNPTIMYFSGSTWGTSLLKPGFIGKGLYLEFSRGYDSGRVTTSGVMDVRIIRPVGWVHSLDWVAESL